MTDTMMASKEFAGLLRVVRVDNLKHGTFKSTCMLVDEDGDILDRNSLYYLMSSYSLMGRFVEEGQIWDVINAICWIGELTTESGFSRPVITIEVNETSLRRPSGKHLIWHFTHSDWYPGIGRNKAINLIDTLSNKDGHNPLYNALEQRDIAALSRAKQITDWDAEVLIKGWARHGSTDTLKWFEDRNIDVTIAKKIFEFHGERTIEAIIEDPYRLSSFNMPWREVDELAKGVFNIHRSDPRRLQAAVTEALWGAYNNEGHTRIPVSDFSEMMERLLGGDLEDWSKAHLGMVEQSRGIIRDNHIHHFEAAVMEVMVANRITDLMDSDYIAPLSSQEMIQIIKRFEWKQGPDFKLTEQQKLGITTSVSHPFSIITGGAGVGKTTVLKALYALYDEAGFKRKQLALSGRAAQRMFEATQEEASTIAGYLYNFYWDDIPRDAQSKMVLVIDEASMIDIHSMYQIINKTPACVHLILIGDPYQLPPVGGGLVLHELVVRDYLPISELSVVKRQGVDSSIPKVAADIRNGLVPEFYGDNVKFYDVQQSKLADRAIAEYRKKTEKSQIICGTNRLVFEVNRKAQELMNPNGSELRYRLDGFMYDTGIRKNDPIICTANIYREEYDLRNGSMGMIIAVYDLPKLFEIKKSAKSKHTILVESFGMVCWENGTQDGYITELPLEIIQSLQLSYGITVHKSQGSQFPYTIFAATNTANLDRTLVYTAITRASEHAVIMGDLKAVNRAIMEQPSSSSRCVGLGYFIDEIMSGS